MPEIKDLSSLGIGKAQRPNLTRYESVDLQYNPNEYDLNYVPGESQMFNRSSNQSWAEQLAQGLVGRTLSLVPKIVGGFGSVASVPQAIADGSFAPMWENSLTVAMNEADEKLKEVFPVYQSSNYAESGLVGKFGTTSFWASDAFDAIAFAASAYVPGAAAGKAGSAMSTALRGTKIADGIIDAGTAVNATIDAATASSKAAASVADVTKATSKYLKKMIPENAGTVAFSTAYNVIAEAGVEAYGVKKELMDYYMNVKGLTSDEANQKASVQAERVFKTNMSVLIIPNLVQSMFFHGASKSVHNKVKESIWRNGSKDLDAVIGKNNMLKSIAKGIVSEGFIEENAQTSAQQYERLLAAGRLSDEDNYFKELAYGMYDNTKGFVKSFVPGAELTEEQMEGSVAIGLGGLIGGGFGVIGATRDRKAFNAAKDYESKRYQDLFTGETGKVANILFNDNKNYIYKLDKANPYREVEVDGKKVNVPNFELDQNNNPIIDEQAIANMTISSAFNKRLWDAHQVAMYRNNPTMLELNKNIALASMVNNLMVKGYSEEEIGLYLDDFEQNGNKFAAEIGVESDIKSSVQTLKRLASELTEIESRMSMSLRDRNPKFSSFKRANLMYLTTKLNTLRTLDPKTEGVAEAIQDAEEHINFLNSKEAETEFSKFYTNRETLEAKLSNLNSLKDKTTENLEEINSITYELRRQAYVDGYNPLNYQEQTAATRGTGRNRVTNVGLRNELSSAYGRSKLAIEDINSNPNDPIEIKMRKFNNIEVSNPEVEELKANLDEEVIGKLEEIENKNSQLQAVKDFYTDIEDEFDQDEDFTYTLAEVFKGQEDSGLAKTMTDVLGVDFNTPITKEVFDNVVRSNAENFFNAVQENYDKAQEKFENFLNTPTTSLMQEGDTFIKEWENSLMNDTENEFLDGKFLDQMFVRPAKNFIKQADSDKDFDDDFSLYQLSSNLKVALDYLKSVDHPRYNEIKDLYDYITNDIQNKIINNLSKRAEKHMIINNAITSNMVEVIQMLFPDNPKVKSVLDVIEGEVLSFDGALTLLNELKNTLTQDEVDALLDRLSKINYAEDFKNFPDVVNSMGTQFNKIIKNPMGVISQLIQKRYPDNPPYITKFLGDFDFYALEKAGQLNKDEFAIQLSKTFNSVMSQALIEDLLTAKKFDYSKFVKIKNEIVPSPSLQQNIALTQGLLFLLNDNKSMMLSRGIGGSGKSYMLGPSLMKIYKELTGDTKEVYAFSKSELASKNINTAIHNDANKGSFQNFETINVDNYAYIVIDEVYTFTNEELEAILSKAGSKTKVIMLGDPSQVKAEASYLIDDSIKANDVRISIPLTTSYRTNVSQISSFISRFQLTTEDVTSSIVAASEDFIQIDNTSTINGIATGTVEDIRRLAAMPSTRSRVIIVASEAAKIDFQGLSIPVLTVQESQGYQWDEVYSYLDVNDLPSSPFEKNKFYYTAYSRAKNFLFVNHAGIVNTAPNPTITSNIETASQELIDAAEMYKDNLNNAAIVSDILNGRVTVVPPSSFAINDENPLFPGNPEVAEDSVNSNAYIDIPIEEEFFAPDDTLRSLAYPSNAAISQDVDFSAPAIIVKVDYNGTTRLAVVGKTLSGRYRVMSYLGKKDMDINPAFDRLLNTNTPSISRTDAMTDMDIPNISLYSAGELTIMSYRKMGNSFNRLNPTDSIQNVIDRFESSYFRANEAGVFRQQDPNVKLKYSVKIFKRSEAAQIRIDYPNFTPKYGVPYLVVDNIKEVGSDKSRSHLIQLNPARFSKSSPLYAPIRSLYDNIRLLEQEFNAPGTLLGTEDFADLVRNYSDFYVVVNGKMVIDPNLKTPLDFRGKVLTPQQEKAVGSIVELIYGVNKEAVSFKDEDTAQKWLEDNGKPDGEDFIVKGFRILPPVKNNSGRYILKYADDPQDPDSTATYLEDKISESQGPAAKALNDIARANARLNDRQLRITLTSSTKKYTRFASILSNFDEDGKAKAFIDYDMLYRDYAISVFLKGVDISKIRNTAQLKKLIAEGSKTPEAIKAFPELENNPLTEEEAGIQVDRFQAGPVEIQYLEDIVGDNSFDSDGRHIQDPNLDGYPLREPLNMNEINTLGKDIAGNSDKLNNLLYSDFEGVANTEIRYRLTDVAIPIAPTTPDPEITYGQIFDTLPAQSPEIQVLIDSIRDLVRDVRFEHVLKGSPLYSLLTPGGKPALLSTDGRVLSPVPYSQVPVEILIHEAIHAIADSKLDKGLADAKAKRNTDEARFYKKVSALRKRFISAVRNKKDEDGNKINLKSFFQASPSDPTAKEFLASLSNENFRKTASNISALPKARKKVSIFRQLLEEILTVLGLREDANLYEALTQTLLDFYRTTPVTTTAGSTVVTPEETIVIEAAEIIDPSVQVMNHPSLVVTQEQVDTLKDTYLSDLNDELLGLDEFEFETRVSELDKTGNFENLPSYGDAEINITFSSSFNNLPLLDQYNFTAPPSGSYAYFTTNKDFIDAQEGAIRSTKVITSEVDKAIKRSLDAKNPLDRARLNLVKGIVVEAISNPSLDLLNLLRDNINNRPFIMERLYNEIFSRADIYDFSVLYNTAEPSSIVQNLSMPNDPIGNNIIEAIRLLDYVDIASVKDMVEGRAAHRYTKAKEFLIDLLAENKNRDNGSSNELILSRNEVLATIESKLKDPNTVFASGTLSQINTEINSLIGRQLELSSRRRTSDESSELNQVEIKLASLQDEFNAYKALNSINRSSGKMLYKDLIKDIYPKTSFDDAAMLEIDLELASKGEEEFYSNKDRTDKEIEAAKGIIEFLKLTNVSRENTLSESMKDTLAFIQVNGKYLSANLAYIKTMQVVTTLDWSQGLFSVVEQLSKYLNEPGLSVTDRAIAENVFNNIKKAYEDKFLDGITLSPNMGILTITSKSGTVSYKAYYKEGLTFLPSLEDIFADSSITSSPETFKTTKLYDFMKEKNPNLTIAEFNRYFTKAEAINATRGIVNTMASMKETELYIATRSLKQGVNIRMIRSKASDVSFTIKEHIQSKLYDMYVDDSIYNLKASFENSNINGQTIKTILSSGTSDQKIQALKRFYNFFNIQANDLTISPANINELIEKIDGLLGRVEKLRRYYDIEDSVESKDSTSDMLSFDDWLEEYDGYITSINDVAGKSDLLIRNPSVPDLDGNRFYKYHESSFIYDQMLNLININSALFSGSKGSSKVRRVPKYIAQSDFYKHNPFVRHSSGLRNTVYAIGEFAGSKNLDNLSSTSYLRENRYFYFQRKFVSGFMDGLKQSNGKSYFQFSYIPSDSPKHPVFKVGLIPNSDINNHIQNIINQGIEKLDVSPDVVHYNNSINNDLFRNFTPVNKALEALGLKPKDLVNKPELVKQVALKAEEIIEKEALDYLTSIVNDTKPTFDVSFAATMFNLISRYKKSSEKGEDIGTPINPKFDSTVKEMKEVFSSNKFTSKYKSELKYILPMFELMYKNNAVNSYFLNQLYLGDPMFYKDSPDVVKRFAGAKAPGIKGLIDIKIGMKETYNLGILADTAVGIEETRDVFKKLFFGESDISEEQQKEFDSFMGFFGDSFESTDAQGFMLPSRLADLSRGFEKSWELGTVHKPVHFGVYPHEFTKSDGSKYTTAKPVYIKNSTVVLSDDLVDRFPLLKPLRDIMVNQNLDELVFKSGVKEGAPAVEYFSMQQLLEDNTKSIPSMTLSNHNFRLQFNASADPNKKVAIFTQLQYFLNVYGTSLEKGEFSTTQQAARKVYSLVADLIDMGADEVFKDIDSSLKSFLRKEFKGPSSARILDILNSGADLNHPLLEKKAITAITSAIEKQTIKIKFNGGKLVLQSAEGISTYPGTEEETDEKVNTLSYKREKVNGRDMMVAEVILPRELLTPEQLKQVEGKGEPLYAMPDGFAFRIPSTELHSAIAFRVVGTYSNKKSNVIIVPKEVVPIHGSDFDVDGLFVITREVYDKDDLNVYKAEDFNGLINRIALLYNIVVDAQKANPESAGSYIKLRKAMNTVFKIGSDLEIEDVESNVIMDEYNKNLASPTSITDKAKWAKENGYKYFPKDDKFIVKSEALSTLKRGMRTITDMVDKTPELSNLKTAVNAIIEEWKKLEVESEYKESAPVGHILVDNVYVLDETEIEKVNTKLASLQATLNSLQGELLPLFKKDIENSIKSLKSIKKKLIRNNIIDVMLQVITDPANKFRMTTPIAFVPIDNVLKSSALKPLAQDKTFDLSTMEGEFDAYAALTAGVVLTGAFANSAKSFGYLAQAGASPVINNLYSALFDVSEATSISQINEIATKLGVTIPATNDNTSLETFKADVKLNIKQSIDNNLATEKRANFNSPILAKAKQFSISIEDTTYNIDKLSDKDVLSNYTVTQVLDALTNAATDNLKLGLLPKARINQYTGSAVVGLVSTGVPIDFVIHLLYQGVFNDLFTGKVQNIDTWINEKLKEYSTIPDTVLDYDSIKFNVGKVSDANRVTTANSLRLFQKAHSIGEDMRNFSNFLGVIQDIDPFVEDLFSVLPKAQKNIGTIRYIDGKATLVPNESFSFVSTNILQSAPHVEAGVRLLDRTVKLIEQKYIIHSKEVQQFANTIDSVYSERVDSFTTNARIRRTFAKYILASTPMVMERLSEVKPRTITLPGKDKGSKSKLTLSGQRVFNNDLANIVQKLQAYEANTAVFGTSNYFLKHISTPTSDNGTKVIKFRSSIGLSPEDIGKIIIGFRELAKYRIEEDGDKIKVKVADIPINFISPIQKDLVIYALLNLGLENMTSSFAAYLPPSMFEPALNYYVSTLNKMINNDSLSNLREHFNLYYNLANAKSLIKPDYTLEEESDKETKHGMEMIDNRPVYYNIKYNVDNESDPTKKHSFPLFIKETYNKDTTVYVKVYQSTDNKKIYYQRVGKIRDVYTNDMIPNYNFSKYFSPNLISVPALDITSLPTGEEKITTSLGFNRKTNSYTALASLLKENDVFAYYPNDNFDRSQRKFGKVVRSSANKNILTITVQPANLVAVAISQLTDVPTLLNTDTKQLLDLIKCHG